MLGSEILAKDVLEIVVFEKRVSHAYGTWRIHKKIPTPEGESARSDIIRTKICEVIDAGVEEQKEIETAAVEEPPKLEGKGTATEDLTQSRQIGVSSSASVQGK